MATVGDFLLLGGDLGYNENYFIKAYLFVHVF